ncbi:acyl-CoA dehydrogenase family protein [Nocardioides campestrisoli]|uniref:acyl-CoA dehydrogenase family protein n=1 Tax=Nocardioides campestrisoli TaxID=2736757 RepID=UPI00163DC65F|nr:acyl-CoA dehydrogenase family protein [Nocardioides campestrisoli]
MDFDLPPALTDFLAELDAFIEKEIKPLEAKHPQYFDHRREWARTNWEADGTPAQEWEDLLAEMKRLADRAGLFRYALPEELGGRGASNLEMAVVREHLAAKGLGLHNDLQNESSIVANLPFAMIVHEFGTQEQKDDLIEGMITGTRGVAFALTEPDHGSDATWMETRAVRDGDHWVINGRKKWNSGVHSATHDVVFARTSGKDGDARGITAFVVPMDTPGLEVTSYDWTFNMPTDHANVSVDDVRVPHSAILGKEDEGLMIAQHFLHENRIRQAASSLGAAQYCIDRAVERARQRKTFGEPLSRKQAVQWPLVELHTEAEMVRGLVRKAAWTLDRAGDPTEVSEYVSMANYRANRLVCEAADRAIQVFGGEGYSRNQPFEHIYRHHRRYRITEGAEEIQIRKVAGTLFGFMGSRKKNA